MKKSFLLLFCLILLSGCSVPLVSTESTPSVESAPSEVSEIIINEPAYPTSYDPVEWANGVTPVVDSEVVLSNGVKPLMTPEEVMALVGAENFVAETGSVSGSDYISYNGAGIRYTFYLSQTRRDLFPNEPSGKYLLTDIHIEYDENGDPSAVELFRGIKMRTNIKDVLKTLPTDDGTFDISDRMIYNVNNTGDAGDIFTPHANMYLIADSFYTMRIVTERYLIDINFSNPNQNVRWIDIFPKGL